MRFDPYPGVNFAVFSEADWTHTPTAKTQGKWTNVKNPKYVKYQPTNPGVGKEGSKPADQKPGEKPGEKAPAKPVATPGPAKPAAKTPKPNPARDEAHKAATDLIGKIKGGDRSPEAATQLIGHLTKLTVPQLKQLRDTNGLKCPAKLKAGLVQAIGEMMSGQGSVRDVIKAIPTIGSGVLKDSDAATLNKARLQHAGNLDEPAPPVPKNPVDDREAMVQARIAEEKNRKNSAMPAAQKTNPPPSAPPAAPQKIQAPPPVAAPKSTTPAPRVEPQPVASAPGDFSLNLDTPAPKKPETSEEFLGRFSKEMADHLASQKKPEAAPAATPGPAQPPKVEPKPAEAPKLPPATPEPAKAAPPKVKAPAKAKVKPAAANPKKAVPPKPAPALSAHVSTPKPGAIAARMKQLHDRAREPGQKDEEIDNVFASPEANSMTMRDLHDVASHLNVAPQKMTKEQLLPRLSQAVKNRSGMHARVLDPGEQAGHEKRVAANRSKWESEDAKAKSSASTAQSPAPSFDASKHVSTLKDRLTRSKDRETFPRAEAKQGAADLAGLTAKQVRDVAEQAGVKLPPRGSKKAILEKIEAALDAGHRAYESIEA